MIGLSKLLTNSNMDFLVMSDKDLVLKWLVSGQRLLLSLLWESLKSAFWIAKVIAYGMSVLILGAALVAYWTAVMLYTLCNVFGKRVVSWLWSE